ncbi:MAG: hypothetical protein WC654_02575 [Patescibacteria group bacterium]
MNSKPLSTTSHSFTETAGRGVCADWDQVWIVDIFKGDIFSYLRTFVGTKENPPSLVELWRAGSRS